jgi:hypothetical protein
MPAGIEFFGNRVAQPADWQAGFVGRDQLVTFPARCIPAEFIDDMGVAVKLTANASPGTNERQTITIDATGGVWTIAALGKTPVEVAEAVSVADLQIAINSLVGAGNVRVVSGTPGTSYVLDYIGVYAGMNVSNTFFTLDATGLTGGAGTAVIAETTAGAAGSATIAFTALSEAIPSGTVLEFGPGQYVRTSAAAAKGATSVAVDQMSGFLLTGDMAVYSGARRKTILSGRLMGRTYAEAAAGTGFGKADVDNDEEIFLSAFTVVNAYENDDVEFLRHGEPVKLNYLPGYADLTAAEIAWIRANYIAIIPQGG